jgi:hypothetical protein
LSCTFYSNCKITFDKVLLMKFYDRQNPNAGYVLPLTLGVGLALLILGLTAALFIQTDRDIARQRQRSGISLAVAEGAADRVMAQLSSRNNAILLGRNYDPINPNTNQTYLGADAQPNSGDETNSPIDEWTGFTPAGSSCFQAAAVGNPNLPLSGTIGAETYQVLAYRYNPTTQTGIILVSAEARGQRTTVAIELQISPDWQNFPTVVGLQLGSNPIVGTGIVALRGRQLLGNANVYYNNYASADPALTGSTVPNALDRARYIESLWNSPSQDGAAGGLSLVSGSVTACYLFNLPEQLVQPTNVVVIDSSNTLTGYPGQVTRYWVDKLNLDNNDILTVDTTDGPVEIRIKGDINDWSIVDHTVFALADNAKIVNLRTDGKAPRVGDLRIIGVGHYPLLMTGQSCIQNALLWLPVDELWLMTSAPGCAPGRNANIEGVVWAEAIISSKNSAINRDINYLATAIRPYDITITPGVTSGIFVPDDLSGLDDLIGQLNWPTRYRIRGILGWRQVQVSM